MNWMQVEAYLEHDDRAILPLGSTEQHSHLRLTVDCILPERIGAEAAEPLGVPVFPVVAYGVTPYFREFPGTISLRVETHLNVVRDILDSMAHSGFRRILIVNGHGGNTPARAPLEAWGARWHDWWDSAAVREEAAAVYPGDATHASWFESFPWTRLTGVELPTDEKPMVTDREALRELEPAAVRAAIGDGSYGGPYAVSDEEALRVWNAGVTEVRALIESL